jgi:hypothetical protein
MLHPRALPCDADMVLECGRAIPRLFQAED